MNERKYEHFSTEDFLEDPYFKEWVLVPTSESQEFWENYLQNHLDKQKDVQEAVNLLKSIHHHFGQQEKEVRRLKAKASFANLAAMMEDADKAPTKVRKLWLYVAVAASVIILIGFGWYVIPSNDSTKLYATGNGERMQLILPDSSVVHLNANSTLEFARSNWKNQLEREVWLNGEGYFEVKKKVQGTKFIVHAGDVNIAVLGTAFNVRSRGENAEVVLAEGKIALAVEEQMLEMEPGDLVSYSPKSNLLATEKVNAADYSAWKDGKIIFNSNLADIANELEILYGKKILIEDPALKSREIHLSADGNSLGQVLSILEIMYSGELSIEQVQDSVIIRKK